MIAPINYSGLLAQLDLSPLRDGIAARNQNRAFAAQQKAEAERMALQRDRFTADETREQQAQARKQAFFSRFAEVSSTPSAEGWQALQAEFPEYQSEVGNGEKGFTARQNLIGRDAATNLYARLHGGDTTGALELIDGSLPALAEHGLSTDTMATVRQLVASGKPEQLAAANRITTMMLAQYSGDRFGDVLGTLGREDREADLHPYRLNRAEADADYAETRARYAPQQQQETLKGKQARTAKTLSPPARRGGGGGRASRAPTMAGTMAPILSKVARGEALTPGEQTAWTMYRTPSARRPGKAPAPAASTAPPARTGIVTVRSAAEAARLPPGTMFKTPDGRMMRR